MPKLALKMSSAACTANPARAGDPRCIMQYGTASERICITWLQLYPNAVRPAQSITKLGSDCQTGQCWSNIAQDSVAALPVSHLKCQTYFSALFSCKPVWNMAAMLEQEAPPNSQHVYPMNVVSKITCFWPIYPSEKYRLDREDTSLDNKTRKPRKKNIHTPTWRAVRCV